ncbi:MAG: transposase [Actinomycetota bacterium]|nr:transposase [Actinomycetota bacterium]
MARKPRRHVPDGTFHVTSRGVARSTVYRDAHDYRLFLVLLRDAVDRWAWHVHVLCLMPNHFHLVVEATGPRLSAGLHRVNGVYAQSFNARHERSGHLFGDRFYTRVVRDEAHLREVCRYVLQNPVRAGLARTAGDWPWSYSRYDAEAG